MVMGIAMIKVVPGREKSAYCAVKNVSGVLDVYHTFGEFDLFMVLQTEGLRRLNQIVEEIKENCDVIAVRTILVGLDSSLTEHEPVRASA